MSVPLDFQTDPEPISALAAWSSRGEVASLIMDVDAGGRRCSAVTS